jgi:hypothetical protein
MQSSIYNTSSPRHHSSPATSRRPRLHTSRSRTASHGESHLSTSDVASNSFLARKMANGAVPNGANGANGAKQSTNPELDKIRRNSLYMTFNAPQVDDYVCNLILILPSLCGIPHFINSGDQVAVSKKVTSSKKFLPSLTSYTSSHHVFHSC